MRILPYLEEKNLYAAISQESTGFADTKGAFDPIIWNGSTTWQHASCVTLPGAAICPSWGGNGNTNGQTTVDSTSTGAPEYASVNSSGTAGPTGSTNYTGRVAPTNYKAVVGTQINSTTKNPLEDGAMLLTASQRLVSDESAR